MLIYFTICITGLLILLLLLWLIGLRRLNESIVQLGLREAEVKTLKAQAEESVGLTTRLIGAMTDPLLVLDTGQRILLANPAAEGLWGRALVGETLIGATRNYDLDVLVRQSVEHAAEPREEVLQVGSLTFQCQASVVAGSHDPVQILILRDITELRSLGRARRDMVHNISHELRTPIFSISLNIDTLLSMDLSDEVEEILLSIRQKNQELAQLAEEMRDLSQIESGQMPIRLVPVPLDELLEFAIAPVATLAENKQHNLVINAPSDVKALADNNAIQRALKNIVHNAIKFCPEGSRIELKGERQNGEIILSISDNGPGIAEEDLNRIFERFFQGDRSRSDGTGLGLAIARHIIKAHGGRLWVTSEEGMGATFYIALHAAGEND